MSELNATGRRLLHRLLQDHAPTPTTADGADAVAAVEAWVCGAPGASGRGALAAALGRAAAGCRATAFLSGPELLGSLDVLAEAARRRLPLVIHLTAGSDHSAYHASAAAGAVQLFATGVQEAVDASLVARRLAETALVPVLVAMDGAATAAEIQDLLLPAPASMRRFLGEPGDLVHPPTPSQELLFGQHRRRLPRWHDPQRPLLTGVAAGAEAHTTAEVSRRVFFDAHFVELLESVREAYGEHVGRRVEALRRHHVDRARWLLLAQGAAVETAEAAVDHLRGSGLKAGAVGLRQLRPLPDGELARLAAGRNGVVVLERLGAPGLAEGPLAAELRGVLERARENHRYGAGAHPGLPALAEKKIPRLASAFYGLGGVPLHGDDLAVFCRRLAERDTAWPSPVYLGLSTSTATGGDPKREALQGSLERDYPGLAHLGIRAAREVPEEPPRAPREVPAVVRRMGRGSTPLADLAEFHGRVGMLYAEGRAADLTPDPMLATATVPPLSAALGDVSAGRSCLPAFDPAPCTGCGVCWSVCPHGALAPGVVAPRALLDLGMARARAAGHPVDKLRMVLAKLADQLARRMASPEWQGGTAGDLLDATFEALLAKMKLPEERAAGVREAFAATRDEIAGLPVAHTAAFADRPAAQRGLFTLAIDPEACKGCGLCVEACEPAALAALPEDTGRSDAARRLLRLAEALPEPDAETVEHARAHPEVGALAGALMTRPARQAMAGVDGAEAGSGASLALRQVLGAAAFHLAPRGQVLAAEVEELRQSLAKAVHRQLARALPDRDLDALAGGLDALEGGDAEIGDLTARIEGALAGERVDVPATRRLVAAARGVADAAWRLTTGEGGLGRAPFGLVLAPDVAAWAAAFPANPFRVPATVAAAGEAAAVARGVCEGQLEQTLELVRALRRGRLELERAERPAAVGAPDPVADLEQLSWPDLTPEERRFCPPLVLVMTQEASVPADLARLMAADLPLRAILLSEPRDEPTMNPEAVATALPDAFFAQTSIAEPEHLESAVAACLEAGGAALVRVLAPRPEEGTSALERARAAVAAGDFALFRSDRQPATADAPAEAPPDAGNGRPEAESIAALEQRHAAELAALRGEAEARSAEIEKNLRRRTAQRVRRRLLQLALAPRGEEGRE